MNKGKNNNRLISLDILRGFDLVWILGAEKIWLALFTISGWPLFKTISLQFEHAKWQGFHFYDLIFPLFIFISGVTTGYAGKQIRHLPATEQQSVIRKALSRFLILVVLGILYNHGWGQGTPLDFNEVRYASVLARIGFCWLGATLLYWYFSPRTLFFIATIILLGYAIFQRLIPPPSHFSGDLVPGQSWNAWFDQHFLPGITYRNQASDPEGLFSQIPAIANALAGVLCGHYLRTAKQASVKPLLMISGVGTLCCLLALIWSYWLPLIKHLWTSSFALLTIGLSCIFLAIFYWLFEHKLKPRYSGWLAAIGANSILFYLLTSLFDWQYFIHSLLGGFENSMASNVYPLLAVILLIAIQGALATLLYNKKIFFRV